MTKRKRKTLSKKKRRTRNTREGKEIKKDGSSIEGHGISPLFASFLSLSPLLPCIIYRPLVHCLAQGSRCAIRPSSSQSYRAQEEVKRPDAAAETCTRYNRLSLVSAFQFPAYYESSTIGTIILYLQTRTTRKRAR